MRLDSVSLRGLRVAALAGTMLVGTTLAGTTLAGTTLAGTTLAGTTLAGTTLAGTTLAWAALAGLTLTAPGCARPRPTPARPPPTVHFGAVSRHARVAARTVSVRAARATRVTRIEAPAGVRVLEAPRRLSASRGADLTVGIDTSVRRSLDGEIVLYGGAGPAARVPVSGEVSRFAPDRAAPHAHLDAYFEERRGALGLVGVGAAVVRDGQLVYLGGYGWEDRDEGVPVDPRRTVFRWGSLSKGITGAVAALADAEGVLDLDDPVSRWVDVALPEKVLPRGCRAVDCAVPMSPGERVITLRQLLSHTAGVQDYDNGTLDPVPPTSIRNDPGQNGGFVWALRYWSDAPLLSRPGRRHRYSSFGFNLAGAALDRALGGYLAFVESRITARLGLTSFGPDDIWHPRPRRAVGYRRDGEDVVPDGDDDVSYKLPAGGFASTPADLARWCAGLVEGVVLPTAARAELWRAQPGAPRYGLGFYTHGRRVSHSGGQQSTRTALIAYPGARECYVVMTNSTWVNPYRLAAGMVRADRRSDGRVR